MVDETLLQWATERQLEYIAALKEHGTLRAAGEALGVHHSTIDNAIKRLKAKAVKQGYSPQHDMERTVPEGFSVKGVSTYYDEDGKPRGQWVKSQRDNTQRTLEALQELVKDIIEPIKGVIQPTCTPTVVQSDLLCVYPIADVHLGLYAWKQETGEDWDTDKCSEALLKHMTNLVIAAPPAETAFIAVLGDFFHADTVDNRTLKSGNILDVDTRWGRVIQLGVKCLRQMIELALTRHGKVIVKSAKGNHDEHSGFALMMLMMAYFENEPRVEIHLPNNPFQYLRFGQSLIGINHMVKAERLPLIMATDERELWGCTRWHFWYSGHIHHEIVKEYPGCVVETFRSPSPKDSYTHGAGYRAERSMIMIKHHIEKGDVGRIIETIY